MIAGFHPADAGEILIGGARLNDVPPHRRPTAMVFQEYTLFPHNWVEAGGMTWTVDVPSPGEAVLSGQVSLELPRDGIHLLAAP